MIDPAELLIGAHMSIAGGVHNALLSGQSIGATTIQIFTVNQRRWQTQFSLIPDEEVSLWHSLIKGTGIQKVMSHAAYLINLGSPDPETLKKSLDAFEKELLRCHQLDLAFLNFHPGNYVTYSEEECLEQVIKNLKKMASVCEKGKTKLLIENTAGQGTAIGYNFKQLGYLINNLKDILNIGICLDTCHAFVAGYDLRNAIAWNETLDQFDKFIGLKHLSAFHVNDSEKVLGSRVDRHACLGNGEIGLEGFKAMMQNKKLTNLPKYLETPLETEWKKEIKLLRNFSKE